MKSRRAAAFLVLACVLACASNKPAASEEAGAPAEEEQPTTGPSDREPPSTAPEPRDTLPASGSFTITVDYRKGTHVSPPVVYAIWVEDDTGDYMVPLYVCKRLLDSSLTGTALPYWSLNKRPATGGALVDAVTGATVQSSDFSVSAKLDSPPSSKLSVHVEMDHSFDPNDWFGDQPAIVWSAALDLAAAPLSKNLEPIGWTPQNPVPAIKDSARGHLHPEMRYITHHKDGNGFGPADDRSAVHMVDSLTVSVTGAR